MRDFTARTRAGMCDGNAQVVGGFHERVPWIVQDRGSCCLFDY
jgi:hypothetical protein